MPDSVLSQSRGGAVSNTDFGGISSSSTPDPGSNPFAIGSRGIPEYTGPAQHASNNAGASSSSSNAANQVQFSLGHDVSSHDEELQTALLLSLQEVGAPSNDESALVHYELVEDDDTVAQSSGAGPGQQLPDPGLRNSPRSRSFIAWAMGKRAERRSGMFLSFR